MVTRRDRLFCAAYILLWLLPAATVGFAGGTVFPQRHLDWLYHISCLFSHRQTEWVVFHPEIRVAGSEEWEWLPFEGFAPMETFGYSNRLDRRLRYIYKNRDRRRYLPVVTEAARAQEREIAEWIGRRWKEVQPERPPLDAVRFVRVEFIPEQDLTTPRGPWDKTAFREAPKNRSRRYGRVSLSP